MGVVYRAEDTGLQRPVALKFFTRAAAADGDLRAQMLNEGRAAAALDHPNICSIYDVGESDGHLFLAMAYLDGETLASRIERGPLSAQDAAPVIRQIASGLGAAHGRGIVHRDVKSSNILLTKDGQAKITDFGIAGPGQPAAGALTVPPRGTAAYMSPEQTRGDPVDQRSDLWALGVVLYEMLTGRLPFSGEYSAAVSYAVQNEEPREIGDTDPPVPENLCRIIKRLLEKNPAGRYQNAAELIADLEGPVTAGPATSPENTGPLPDPNPASRPRTVGWALFAGFVVLLAAGVWWAANQVPGRPKGPVSIAVMPLDNLSQDTNQEYFAEGMTQELITVLARIDSLRVISSNSAARFREPGRPIAEIAAALNVDYIVRGSVMRQGGQVRINAQLVDVRQDRHLWAERYDRALSDVLTLQSDVARAIASEIQVQFSPAEDERLGRPARVDPEFYEAYLRGRYFLSRRTPQAMARALEQFEQLVKMYPDQPLGYVGLADAYVLHANQGLRPPEEVWPKAKEAAAHAVSLDASLSEAHSTLGLVRSFYEWNWKGAEQEFKKAIELEKNNPNALSRYAIYLSRIGRHDEAIEYMERARAMDPLSLNLNNAVAVLYYMAQRYDEATERCEANLELSSTYYRTYWNLGRSRLAKSEFGPAIDALERARELSREKPSSQVPGSNPPNGLSLENPFMTAVLADGYARAGRTAEARRVVDQLNAIAAEKYVSPAAWAAVYLGLGETDRAFDWLGKAVEERSSLLVWLKVDPAFDTVRGDPRFGKLLVSVGLD